MNFIATHSKSFATIEEYNVRFGRWLVADEFINEVNHPDSIHTHTAAHNKFSTWTEAEYEKLNGLIPEHYEEDDEVVEPFVPYVPSNDANLGYPTSVDWRTSGCETAVKDQGSCGSCWTFATTETTESAYCLAGNALLTLSEQQLVDCCTVYNGCEGGNYPKAWDYIADEGQMLEADYPYTATDGNCSYNSAKAKVKIDTIDGSNSTSLGNYLIKRYGTPEEIMAALALKPAAIAINASGLVF